jgi:hypothetical protein
MGRGSEQSQGQSQGQGYGQGQGGPSQASSLPNLGGASGGKYPQLMQKLQGMQGGDAGGVMPWDQLTPLGGASQSRPRPGPRGMGSVNAQSFSPAGAAPSGYAPSATPITTGGSVASTQASPAATGQAPGAVTPPSSVVGAQPGPSGPPPAAPSGAPPTPQNPGGGSASQQAIMQALRQGRR